VIWDSHIEDRRIRKQAQGQRRVGLLPAAAGTYRVGFRRSSGLSSTAFTCHERSHTPVESQSCTFRGKQTRLSS
jgi:hypothetical protein